MKDQASQPTTKSAQTRENIIAAGVKVVATLGIEHATVRAIALEAGVSIGLVSHYIKGQKNLFEVLITEISKNAYIQIENPPTSLSGAEKIIWTFRANFSFFSKRKHEARCFILFYYYACFVPSLKELNVRLINRATDRLENHWREHLHSLTMRQSPMQTRSTATLLHNHLTSSLIKFHSTPQRESPDQALQQILKQLQVLLT
jgi:AcrR family transcriptional regulator